MSVELFSLEWFRHVVTPDFVSWAVLCRHDASFHLVCDKEILDVDVAGSRTHALESVLLELDRALVVLQDYPCFDDVVLGF